MARIARAAGGAQSSGTVSCQVGISPRGPAPDLRLERLLGRRVAVDQVDARGTPGSPGRRPSMNPPSQSSSSGSSAWAENPSSDWTVARTGMSLPLIRGVVRAADEVPAQRPLALVAHEQHRGRRVVQQPLGVADGAPAGEHPVRGHDHVRRVRPRDRLGLVDVLDDPLEREVERRVLSRRSARSPRRTPRDGPVDVGRRLRHRRVEVDRQLGDPAGLQEPGQLPHDLLGPPDGERRDQQHARLLDGVVDDLGQRRRRPVRPARARGRRRWTRTGRCRPR